LEGRRSTIELHPRAGFSLLKDRSASADANHVTEAATEGREQFAAALDAGDELLLARADGPLVDATVLRVDGVDLDLRALAGDLVPGGLATIRLHDGESAWFATLIVLGTEPVEGGAEAVTTRIGDALRVTSERWTERVDLVAPAVLRPEVGPDPMLRAESLNLSLTGVALRVRERPPELGTRIGVVLAGDGDGSIAFRGRVTRSSRTSHGAVLGVEIVGISRDDHRRLQRAISRRFEP
jgi:PilZ domain